VSSSECGLSFFINVGWNLNFFCKVSEVSYASVSSSVNANSRKIAESWGIVDNKNWKALQNN
jgi:hypothetical protein